MVAVEWPFPTRPTRETPSRAVSALSLASQALIDLRESTIVSSMAELVHDILPQNTPSNSNETVEWVSIQRCSHRSGQCLPHSAILHISHFRQ